MKSDRPGYQSRKRRDGTTAHYWNPRRAVAGAPDYLKIVRLDDGLTDAQIVAECSERTAALKEDLMKIDVPVQYDGTIGSLISLYRRDDTSSYHSVKYYTRKEYEASLRVLEKNVADRSIDKLKRSDFSRWFTQWRKKGHRRATGAIKLLRIVPCRTGQENALRGALRPE